VTNFYGISFLRTVAVTLLIGSCSRQRPVRIEVDYTQQPRWSYLLEVQVDGAVKQADTGRTFSNTARCAISGVPVAGKPASLSITLHDVALSSDLLAAAETENVRRQFDALGMIFSCEDGSVVPVDTMRLPIIEINGWNLFHTFARTVPSLPGSRIAPGGTWDRDKMIPLRSSLGNALGHLYQSFRLDSVYQSAGRSMACVSWNFNYKVEFTDSMPSAAKGLPVLGYGTGFAVFDLTGRFLEQAGILFEVPGASKSNPVSDIISWKERVALKRVE